MWELIGAAASALGGYLSAREQRAAANEASQARLAAIPGQLAPLNSQLGVTDAALSGLGGQSEAAIADLLARSGQGIGFQQGQLGQLGKMFAPFSQAGQRAIGGLGTFGAAGAGALRGQQALTGLLGADEQQRAIAEIANSPELAALTQQGETAILQNASATGGLRGGNTQAALAQFRPQLLSGLINQRFGQLGGLAGLGAQSYQGLGQLGAQGLSTQAGAQGNILGNIANLLGNRENTIANLLGQHGDNTARLLSLRSGLAGGLADVYGQSGSALAGNAIAQGQANANAWGGAAGAISQLALLKHLKESGWGGLGTTVAPNTSNLLYAGGSY